MAVKLGQLLLDKGLITDDALAEAQRIQREGDDDAALAPGERLGRIIIRKGLAPPMDVVRALCEQRRIEDYILVSSYVVSPRLVAKVPLEVALRFSLLPLVRLEEDGGETLFATDKTHSPEATREAEQVVGMRVEWVEVSDPRFSRVIENVYSVMAERGIVSVRIGELLVREGLITPDELSWALEIARSSSARIGRVLIDEGLVAETDFYKVLARHKGLPFTTADEVLSQKLAGEVAGRLSRTFAIFNEMVPFRLDAGSLCVATTDGSADTNSLKKIYDCRDVAVHIVTHSDIGVLLHELYGLDVEEARARGLVSRDSGDGVDVLADVRDASGEYSASPGDPADLRLQYEKLVSNILGEAIRRRASDIHVENYESSVLVRIRIDGLLYDARTLRVDKINVAGVVNVIKILCDMNIAERRLPQGGRFKKKTAAGDVFDFRVQVQPTLFGENVVIRLLNQTASIAPLEALGLDRRCLDQFVRAAKSPSGLILITGPTGSGKTTTLYSVLDLLRKDTTIKIVTVEDPIEYSLPRIQQSQTHDLIGFTFAEATRAFLREDPDVALVGEIRDEETARETIKLSQTGHIVFSTLHTNSAISAASRMFVLGVDPELLAGELLVVVAQRLAPRICPDCKAVYDPPADVVREFYPAGAPAGAVFYHGLGCKSCDGLGHRGRVAIGEFWFVDSESRALITRRTSEDEIVRQTIGNGLFPMLLAALEKVRAGEVDVAVLPTVLSMASVRGTAPLIAERNLLVPRRQAAG